MAARSAYREAGVDYETLDDGKRRAVSSALATSGLLALTGGRAHDGSRGEPAFVFDVGSTTLALVVEGLGTKSIIAREINDAGGSDHFAAVAYDAVAAVLNDLICVGALPLVLNAYFATGSGEWYRHETRFASLLDGWQQACRDGGCTWGGGESPTLPGLVAECEIELAGAAVGLVPDGREPLIGQHLAAGDEIVILRSSGLHANGASLARLTASRSQDGWSLVLPDGRTFGEAVMTPSLLYVPFIRRLFDVSAPVHYLSHITGHGLQKLMRPQREFTYRIAALPRPHAELSHIADVTAMDSRDAYGTLNMGCGFALYVAAGSGERVVALASELGYEAILAGTVEDGPRRVILEPLAVQFESHEMSLSTP